MICYKDRTFCPFYKDCKHGDKCSVALTPEVEKGAKEWWGFGEGEPPIMIYAEKPNCYETVKIQGSLPS